MKKIGRIRTLNPWRRLTVSLPLPCSSQIQSLKNLLGNQLPVCSDCQHSRTQLCLGVSLSRWKHPKQLRLHLRQLTYKLVCLDQILFLYPNPLLNHLVCLHHSSLTHQLVCLHHSPLLNQLVCLNHRKLLNQWVCLNHRQLQSALFLNLVKHKKYKLHNPQATDPLRLLSDIKFTQACIS